jgi:hypothetical protein
LANNAQKLSENAAITAIAHGLRMSAVGAARNLKQTKRTKKQKELTQIRQRDNVSESN